MFGNMDLNALFSEVNKKAKEIQEDSSNKEFTIKSGGGLIKLTVNGKGEAVDLSIDDSLLEDKDSLQILLLSCISDAYKMVEDSKKSMALEMLGGMNIFGQK
ncbi:MAG: YbaB/EbfC family nucleoid-associated protein [Campylobacterales bacterium]|nr:YbaB/EbfC family nucleoid-associated protein [Campylobacterales bacterium]